MIVHLVPFLESKRRFRLIRGETYGSKRKEPNGDRYEDRHGVPPVRLESVNSGACVQRSMAVSASKTAST
jgi:hypothetical protein